MANLLLPCSCGQLLEIPEAFRGKRVLCPKCRSALQVPGSDTLQPLLIPPPISPAQEFDFATPGHFRMESEGLDFGTESIIGIDSERFHEEDLPGMKSVSLGLAFQVWRLHLSGWLLCGLPVILLLGSIVLRGNSALVFLLFWNVVGFLIALAVLVCHLTGSALCSRIPTTTGFRGLMFSSLLVDVVAVIFLGTAVSFVILANVLRAPNLALFALFAQIAGAVFFCAGLVLFCLFLRKLGGLLNDKSTAKKCLGTMIFFIVTSVAGPIVVFLTTFLVGLTTRNRYFVGQTAGILSILVLVMLGIVLFRLSGEVQTLQRRIRGRVALASDWIGSP